MAFARGFGCQSSYKTTSRSCTIKHIAGVFLMWELSYFTPVKHSKDCRTLNLTKLWWEIDKRGFFCLSCIVTRRHSWLSISSLIFIHLGLHYNVRSQQCHEYSVTFFVSFLCLEYKHPYLATLSPVKCVMNQQNNEAQVAATQVVANTHLSRKSSFTDHNELLPM